MSTCISSHGEYDSHETDPDTYVCKWCHEFDEAGALAEIARLRRAPVTGMEHAIEQATEVVHGYLPMLFGPDRARQSEHIARALTEAGLLAPAPLREEQRSEHTVRETAAYFARQVQRIGDRISDRDYRRSLVDVVALESVQGFLDRIARDDLDVYAADAVDPAEGDGRAER